MEELYDIMLAGESIGAATVSREGLYYKFCCRCHLTGDVIYRLSVSCGSKTVDLGVCVPVDNGFGIETRVPVKQLGEGKLSLSAVPKHQQLRGRFVPICADEPFDYITRLQQAYLEVRGEQMGIVFADENGVS